MNITGQLTNMAQLVRSIRLLRYGTNDFKSVKKDSVINYPDGTSKKVGEVTAQDIYDCVKKDGSPIDMDLRMDIIYPTNPAQKVPYTLWLQARSCA